MNRPFAYVASPYSHPDPEVVESRVEIVTRVTAILLCRGINAISPIVYGHSIVKKHKLPPDWVFWKAFLTSYLTCSHIMYVVMIDGWKESVGLQEEILIAKNLRIPIHFIDPNNFD